MFISRRLAATEQAPEQRSCHGWNCRCCGAFGFVEEEMRQANGKIFLIVGANVPESAFLVEGEIVIVIVKRGRESTEHDHVPGARIWRDGAGWAV